MLTNIILWSCIGIFLLSYSIFLYTVLSTPDPTKHILAKRDIPLEINALVKIIDDLRYRRHVMMITTAIALAALVGILGTITNTLPPHSQ